MRVLEAFSILGCGIFSEKMVLLAPRHRTNILPFKCRLRDAQPLPILGWLGSLVGPCLVLLGGPYAGPRGFVLRFIYPTYVPVGTSFIPIDFRHK